MDNLPVECPIRSVCSATESWRASNEIERGDPIDLGDAEQIGGQDEGNLTNATSDRSDICGEGFQIQDVACSCYIYLRNQIAGAI
jgi:hypothetical protein